MRPEDDPLIARIDRWAVPFAWVFIILAVVYFVGQIVRFFVTKG